jgi:hypothetical protein
MNEYASLSRMNNRAAGWITAILMATVGAGCAVDRTGRAPGSDAELERQCLGLMYASRSTQGRSSPNWAIRDQCIRQHHP